MTTHTCRRCNGRGVICAKCLKPHEERGSFFRTRCRARKTISCPGTAIARVEGEVVKLGSTAKVIPHFETRTDCDVCGVQKRGELYDRSYGRLESAGWHLINLPDNKSIYLCPACHKRHEEIRTMTLEYLMGDRGGLNGGRWVDRTGVLLPEETTSGVSTSGPRSET